MTTMRKLCIISNCCMKSLTYGITFREAYYLNQMTVLSYVFPPFCLMDSQLKTADNTLNVSLLLSLAHFKTWLRRYE